MANTRNHAIDWLKGTLMLLVMLGHLSGTGVNHSPFKWTLYGFHMPMFMALSGYMLNLEKLRELSFAGLFSRYWARMILPWLVVFVVALPLVTNIASPAAILTNVLKPWNHLWFVPVLFVTIAIGTALPLSRMALMLLTLPIGFGTWAALQVFGWDYTRVPIDIRYAIMPAFFYFGLWLRTANVTIGWWIAPAFAVTLALWGLSYSAQHSLWLLAIYPAMTLSSAALIPLIERLPIRTLWPIFTLPIEIIGAESLFFYLHHPWLFNIARRTLYKAMPLSFAYAVTLITTILVLFAARTLLSRNKWTALLSGVLERGKD